MLNIINNTMGTLLKFTIVFYCLFSVASCEKPNISGSSDIPDITEPDTTEIPDQPDLKVYPEGIKVSEFMYQHENGRKTRYFLAAIDFKENPKLKFTVTLNQPKAKPSEVYSEFDKDYGVPYVVTNAGYFSGSTSVSPVFINNFCSVIAPRSIAWPNYEHHEADVYVVRAAVGQMKDGSFDIAWIYCCDPASRTHYSFPSPLGNDEKTKTFMKEPPTKDTPGAKVWKPVWGVGGGPMLVQDGSNIAMDSYWKECLNSGGTSGSSHQPRTGVGIDKDGKLFLIVCDGRGMKGSLGFTLTEFADVFIQHGAVKAMNLDGGGSSAMVGKDAELLNWPSDSGQGQTAVERRVSTCIAISALDMNCQLK